MAENGLDAGDVTADGTHAGGVFQLVGRALEAQVEGFLLQRHQLLAQLFGLTPQEARLALLLADGSTLAAAAHSLGVAETAARSYSKRIYAKMGIRSQSDIVRMVYRSFALLR